jgi:MoaA/NifB/PqqE/SkfB family radical SAM enzyme
MEESRMLRLADELVGMEIFDITLAGGEPFLNPGIFGLIHRLLDGGASIGVLSNGSLISKDIGRRLVDVADGRNNFLLQISLDSCDPDIHDKTRGMGRRTIENLDHLCSGTDISLQIATVINAYNVDGITGLIDRYYPRVKRYHIMNLQRTWRSLHHKDIFVSEERNKRFWKDLESYMRSMPSDILITGLNLMRLIHKMEDDPGAYCPRSSFTCRSCTAGVTHIEITADFKVIGCDIAKDHTVMGDITNASLKEVWNSRGAALVRDYPFPACYLIKDPLGKCLADGLPANVRNYAETVMEHK